jgi:hypothetical protein
MRIKPWNFYAVRERFDDGDERRMVLILRWSDYVELWEGRLIYEDYHALPCPSWWGMFGGRLPSGFPCVDDLTEHLISCRDLLLRKLNPPIALVVQIEAKRAEEALFAA